jgi:hypothetical protein
MPIPPFNNLGYLPPGVHEASWLEFQRRFATNPRRLYLVTGLAAAVRKLAIAGCRRVIIGGSFVTDNFPVDLDLLDRLFAEDVDRQQEVFGGRLFDLPSYEGFFQTDREGRPRGVVALDPRELLQPINLP